jgi:hypothetical protein
MTSLSVEDRQTCEDIHICNTRARYSSQYSDRPGLCTAASGKTGILYNAMQLSIRQVTGFVNGDGIMQDSNQHVGWCLMAPRATNTLTGLIYVGPLATHFSLLGILVHG